mmetsp:Transcript_31168/g.47683  ORF Transcript_31168/g.47683 Transcript_31168/m.47683 type:complete len:172 (-) Transcript_31168:753-1268(-)
MRAEAEAGERERQRLLDTISEARKEVMDLKEVEQELKAAKQDNDHLQGKFDDLVKHKDHLDELLGQVKANLADIRSEREKLLGQADSYREQVRSLTESVETSEQKVREREDEINRLTGTVREREQSLRGFQDEMNGTMNRTERETGNLRSKVNQLQDAADQKDQIISKQRT